MATISRVQDDALQILAGEKEIPQKVLKEKAGKNYKKLFEEKKFFFDDIQKHQIRVLLSDITQTQMLRQLNLSAYKLQKLKEEYFKILKELSVEEYHFMKNKYKTDVETALKHQKPGVMVNIIKERVLSENPMSLSEIGKKYGVGRGLTQLYLKKLHAMGVETDLPAALL